MDIPLTKELRESAESFLILWEQIQCKFRPDDQDESENVEISVWLEFFSVSACHEAKEMFDRVQCSDEAYVSHRIGQCIGMCDRYCIYQNQPHLPIRLSKWWGVFKTILMAGAEHDKIQELQDIILSLTTKLSEMRQETQKLREAATELLANRDKVYKSVSNLEKLESEILDLDRQFWLEIFKTLSRFKVSRRNRSTSPSKKTAGASVRNREEAVDQLKVVVDRAGRKSPKSFLGFTESLRGKVPFPRTGLTAQDPYLVVPIKLFLGGPLFQFAANVGGIDSEVLKVIPSSDDDIGLAVTFRRLFERVGLKGFDFLETPDRDEKSKDLLKRTGRAFNAFLEALIPRDQKEVAGAVAASGTRSVKASQSAMDDRGGQTMADRERTDIRGVGGPTDVPSDGQHMVEITTPRKAESKSEQSALHNGNIVSSCITSKSAEKISAADECMYTITIEKQQNGEYTSHLSANPAAAEKFGKRSPDITGVKIRYLLALSIFFRKGEPLQVSTTHFKTNYVDSGSDPSRLFSRVKHRIETDFPGVKFTKILRGGYSVTGLEFAEVPTKEKILEHFKKFPPEKRSREKKSKAEQTE